MTKTTRIAASLASGLALLGAGFGLGYTSAPPARRAPPVPPERAIPAPDPAAEPFYEILRDPDAFSRAARLATFLSELGPDSVPTVRATLKEPPPTGFGAVETVLMARFWAAYEPAVAAEWAFHSWEGFRTAVSIPVVEIFVDADPRVAVEALNTSGLMGDTAKHAVERAIVRAWYQSGQPGLMDYIRGLGYGIRRQRAIGVLARETIRHEGSEAIIRWAESLPQGESGPPRDEANLLKLDAFRQVTQALAIADLAAARAWCEKHCDGPFATTLRELLAQRWASRDGRAAMQWIATAPPGKSKDWAVQSAAVGWWRNDRAGMDAYVAAMVETGIEPWFQPALVNYASWTGIQAGEQAKRDGIRWAVLIEDDAKREMALLTITRAWLRQDEAAAIAWLDQSPLSEDARERARSRTPQPRKPKGSAPHWLASPPPAR